MTLTMTGDIATSKISTPASLGPPTVTVIVPTYREVENIPHLVARLQAIRALGRFDIEVLLMDDDSQDGSAKLVDSLALPWIKMITRHANRGLSHAVLDGLKLSQRDLLVVMDADLSHPPEKIPDLLAAVLNGADVAVGSRFAEGGTTADDWGFFRWLNSRVATLLALPLTGVSDPMSGFFAIRRSTFLGGRHFNPVGYKILLELIVKCRCKLVVDVPIHFDNRRYGESKLSFQEQLRYVQHLRRLYIYKFGTWSHLVQFLMVGVSGLAINLLALTVLLKLNVAEKYAVAAAIVISMLWNFFLNRRFSFSYARHQSVARQLVGFIAACSIGAVVNYFTTVGLWNTIPYKQLAATIGVIAGTFFNFTASRFVIFRIRHIKP